MVLEIELNEQDFLSFLINFIPAPPPPILGIPDFHWHYENSSHVSCRVY